MVDVLLKLASAGRAGMVFPQKSGKQRLQEPHFERLDALVLDELRRPQGSDLLLDLRFRPEALGTRAGREIGDAFDIQVKPVLVKDGVGQVRAGVIRATIV